MMAMGVKAGVGALCALAVTVVGAPAQAQGKEMSDKSVLTLMQYAWNMVPGKFTAPNGKVIEVDKSKPSSAIVPIEVAREVVRVGRMSAYASICDLNEEQVANYQTLMRREQAKSHWTDQQMLFINQLHLFTVMTMTGKVQLVEKDGDKQVVVQDAAKKKTETTCTDTERKKIQSQIMAYVGSEPPPTPTAPAGAPATKAVPASQKK